MRRLDPLWILPLGKLALHLATLRGYGLFRDEFYYVACSKRLALGYVDHPPLSMALLALQRALFGESLAAIRMLPAVIGAATVLVVGLLTRRLGGGRFAQSLAMLAVGLNFLSVFHKFSMNGVEVLVWTLAGYLTIRIAQEERPRLWIVLGVLLGLGLQNKISVLWLGLGLGVGLLVTGERRRLATRWPWLAGGLALAIFMPHLLWQAANDWPTLEFMRNATGQKMIEVAPVEFVLGQLGLLSPVVVPLWLTGLGWLLLSRSAGRYRLLAWIYLTVFALLMVSGSSRSGYLGPAYTWLLGAGAVAWEGWLEPAGRRRLRPIAVALIAAGSLATLPFALPVLPVETYVRYAGALGVAPSTEERKELAELPQGYADMHGWKELVDGVAAAWESLSAAERERATVFTYNYGNSGAIDYYGAQRGLPPSISGHNNYWLWGPREFTGEVVIVVGGSRQGLERRFGSVERAGTVVCRYCMPYENDKPIWIARGIQRPLAELWPELKHYD